MNKINVKTGDKYGKLTILEEVAPLLFKSGQKTRMFSCKCDCGKKTVVSLHHLREGSTASCGCSKKQSPCNKKYSQDMISSPLYGIWQGMKRRCYKSYDPRYKNYGKRGIIICDEWKKDYASFYYWAIENGYKKDLSIDRIDNDGNYEPANCRWVTYIEQNNNRSNNTLLTYGGQTHTIAEWSRIVKIKPNTLIYRHQRGWSDAKVLTTPINLQQQCNALGRKMARSIK